MCNSISWRNGQFAIRLPLVWGHQAGASDHVSDLVMAEQIKSPPIPTHRTAASESPAPFFDAPSTPARLASPDESGPASGPAPNIGARSPALRGIQKTFEEKLQEQLAADAEQVLNKTHLILRRVARQGTVYLRHLCARCITTLLRCTFVSG